MNKSEFYKLIPWIIFVAFLHSLKGTALEGTILSILDILWWIVIPAIGLISAFLILAFVWECICELWDRICYWISELWDWIFKKNPDPTNKSGVQGDSVKTYQNMAIARFRSS